MASNGLNICYCGVHVPLYHWDEHLRKGTHKQHMQRISEKKTPLLSVEELKSKRWKKSRRL